MLIFPSEQSEEAELEPQKAVTSLVRQGWRERKGDLLQTHPTLIVSVAYSYPDCSRKDQGRQNKGETCKEENSPSPFLLPT